MPVLSVIIPACNEEASVESVVKEVVSASLQMRLDCEIILVNGGSRDRTGEIGRKLAWSIPNFRLIDLSPGRQYGAALKAGFEAASGELIVFFPADRQFVFGEIEKFLAELDRADIVSGVRVHRKDNFMRRLFGLGWNVVVRVMFGYLCRDIDCGFKLFRRGILERVRLVSDGAVLDTELLAGAGARGYRISEIEVTHLPRTTGKATGADINVIITAFRDLALFRLRLTRELNEEKKTRLNAERPSDP